MKPVLVTGATGFLGWHVARLLTERGFRVRALHRPQSKLRELDVEPVEGDLRHPPSLDSAVNGCSLVFHVAADYRLWSPRPAELYQSNVDGTRNLLEAARRAGVERVVYTSTVGCIGFQKNALADENSPVSLADMVGHYKRSKFLAEQEALRFAREGFPVVIVNPTAPVGDHDFKPTPTGKTIVDFCRGRLPAYVDTGLNIVDARDTALGHLLACEKGRPGERYILGGENLTLQQILAHLAAITRRPAPRLRLPLFVALAAACVSTAWASLTRRPPSIPLEGVRMARKKMWVSSEKARAQLGFTASPAYGALARAVAWFQANGYC